ncbi:D-alanyl-D-alanine carboxypeptidase [Actinacidiphila sp. bgisy167]|uniref:D-alanyl-D-alanine carboxypeptidase family protein n=1 Tax=Actinacidiphila sp. bgisy167 TaxID=3413797 RepID=UPI003D75088E
MPNSSHHTMRRSALVLSALALVGGAALTTAPVAHAKPSSPSATPTPPARMSRIGGDRLGQPGTQVSLLPGAPALPGNITSRSWIVSDAETGQVLAAHNAHWKLAPASTLKMLFADTLLPKLDPSRTYKVRPSDLDGVGAGSSVVGVKENLTYTVRDLWLGVFLQSGNDAVHVLSAMNGGVDATVLEMQRKAAELQAEDTTVISPDGYDMPGQVSSAYDLTLFARSGLQNADFREYCSTVRAKFPGKWKTVKGKKGEKAAKKRETFEIQNTNRLLTGDYDIPTYNGIAGVKNGYTSKAGNTFTGVAQRGDRTLLVTVMHPGAGHNMAYKEAAKLFDWGFEAEGVVTPVGTLVPPKSAVVSSPAPSASPSASSGKTARRHVAAPASSGGGGGAWTAAALAGGSVLAVAALAYLVRRRWPLPQQPATAVIPAPAKPGDDTSAKPKGAVKPGGKKTEAEAQARTEDAAASKVTAAGKAAEQKSAGGKAAEKENTAEEGAGREDRATADRTA